VITVQKIVKSTKEKNKTITKGIEGKTLASKERLYTYGFSVLPQSINLPLEADLARSLHWDSLFGFGSANRVLALDSTRRHSSMLLYREEDHRGDRYGELFRLCGVV
jgi:hypothetical protein